MFYHIQNFLVMPSFLSPLPLYQKFLEITKMEKFVMRPFSKDIPTASQFWFYRLFMIPPCASTNRRIIHRHFWDNLISILRALRAAPIQSKRFKFDLSVKISLTFPGVVVRRVKQKSFKAVFKG